MPQTKNKILFTLIFVLLVFILIASIGAYIGFASITMISWWIPLLFSFIIAAISGTVLWKVWQRLSQIDSFAVNYIAHIIFFSFFLTGILYTLNYIGAANAPTHKEEAFVVEKYREKHYHSRRVGRNRYVRGNAYYEYYIEVKFNNGKDKKIQLPYNTYKSVRSDKNIILSLSKGWLGADVLRTSDILADNPDFAKKTKKKGCRFVGTSGKHEIPDWVKKRMK